MSQENPDFYIIKSKDLKNEFPNIKFKFKNMFNIEVYPIDDIRMLWSSHCIDALENVKVLLNGKKIYKSFIPQNFKTNEYYINYNEYLILKELQNYKRISKLSRLIKYANGNFEYDDSSAYEVIELMKYDKILEDYYLYDYISVWDEYDSFWQEPKETFNKFLNEIYEDVLSSKKILKYDGMYLKCKKVQKIDNEFPMYDINISYNYF